GFWGFFGQSLSSSTPFKPDSLELFFNSPQSNRQKPGVSAFNFKSNRLNIKTMNNLLKVAFAAFVFLSANVAYAQMEKTVEVGGAPMYPSKNIVENAVNSADHTTLVAAVKAAGLVDTLQGKGPFTVFAPDNAAFAKLLAGTVETLLKPKNKGQFTSVLT